MSKRTSPNGDLSQQLADARARIATLEEECASKDRAIMWLVNQWHHELHRGKRQPEYRKRDAEIYQLRTADPKRWTWKALKARYDMTLGAVRQAFMSYRDRLEELRTSWAALCERLPWVNRPQAEHAFWKQAGFDSPPPL